MRYGLTSALLLALAACSSDPGGNGGANHVGAGAMAEVPADTAETGNALNSPAPAAPATPAPVKVIGLEGLGTLRIGMPVPTTGGWAGRGAQTGSECRTVSSPNYAGVYAIVEGGKVQRITVGQRSDVKLVEGIGVGANEAAITAAFPGFRAESHKYEDAPAKYLTAPHAGEDGPGLRFEIAQNGKVSMIHVGLMPALAYVEGCA
jgi:hypothetical protein